MHIDLDEINGKGFLELEATENEFASLAAGLGTTIKSRKQGKLIDELIPRLSMKAHRNSLSRIYGANQFPFHTDGAYFLTPPKYIVLRYVTGIKSPTPTLLLPLALTLTARETEILRYENWLVKARDHQFYSNILTFNDKGNSFIRYDPGCMKPARHKSATAEIIDRRFNAAERQHIEWYPGKTLIINNWHILHARPKVNDAEINFRTIQRIMIDECI